MMNTIQAKEIISFDRQILSIFIDGKPLGDFVNTKSDNPMHKDLWCAWLLKSSQDAWEQHGNYIWTLIEDKQNCNLPILLCPDDMDFWCTVIVAQVCFYENIVVWEKIGSVIGKIDVEQWRKSGIQNIDKWSENDWKLYGGTLAWLNSYDKSWEKWWSEHWLDEENRRLWNYFHPYFNDDENIKWLSCESLSFSVDDYDACVSAFKHYNY